MEAISCLISRRSVREYTREPLSQQEIENVVETSQTRILPARSKDCHIGLCKELDAPGQIVQDRKSVV